MDLICTEPRPHLFGCALSWPGHLRALLDYITPRCESTWRVRALGIRNVRNVVSPQYAFLAKGIFQSTIYNVTFGKSKTADVDMFTL